MNTFIQRLQSPMQLNVVHLSVSMLCLCMCILNHLGEILTHVRDTMLYELRTGIQLDRVCS